MPGHIVLVGLMGSGKTTVGRELAVLLSRSLLDNDEQVLAIRTALECRNRSAEEPAVIDPVVRLASGQIRPLGPHLGARANPDSPKGPLKSGIRRADPQGD